MAPWAHAAPTKSRRPASDDAAARKRARRGAPAAERARLAAAAGAAAAVAVKAAKAPDPGDEVARLQRAAVALQPSSWTGRLPCRDAEQAEISNHLRTAVKQGGSMQVLYISGMPGTGKTASVKHAVEELQRDRSLPGVVPVHINAMRLGAPAAVFADVYRQLPHGASAPCGAGAAYGELNGFFEGRTNSDPVVLLFIDEIDHLITRNQAVLYRIFAWLMLPSPRLVVTAISNTMDLPERLLPRVASRFGIVRVDYLPYRRDQIVQILNERLESQDAMGAFTATTLKLCAARVAAGSGDIRKALQLCHRAVEVRLVSTGVRGPVDHCHLQVAEGELLRATPALRAIGGLGAKPRLLLTALLLELWERQADAVPVLALTASYAKLVGAVRGFAAEEAAAARSSTPRAPGDRGDVLLGTRGHPDEEVRYLVQKLEAMALLCQQGLSSDACRTVALGAGVDNEDLAGALETAEGESGVASLIRESRSQRGAH